VRFEDELAEVLPHDLPQRASVIRQCGRHLELIVEANRQFNLTRIVDPREAAIKHVFDSVVPWKHFAGTIPVLDAGTGAGYPGIPLAVVLPETHFVLADSVGKKARFAAEAIRALGLSNVEVIHARAEEWLRSARPHWITGRALTPLADACALFGSAVRAGSRGLFYKGPDAQAEIAGAAAETRKQRLQLRVIEKYELPGGLGARTLVEMFV
jgi:16S rRNA (guanine527-N7)-methyltransferase